jgi:hypothetical protein
LFDLFGLGCDCFGESGVFLCGFVFMVIFLAGGSGIVFGIPVVMSIMTSDSSVSLSVRFEAFFVVFVVLEGLVVSDVNVFA